MARKNRIKTSVYYPKETHRQISISIKIPLKVRLASYIARTGKTQRGVIIEALEEYLTARGA